jgi:hypothetical protein
VFTGLLKRPVEKVTEVRFLVAEVCNPWKGTLKYYDGAEIATLRIVPQ